MGYVLWLPIPLKWVLQTVGIKLFLGQCALMNERGFHHAGVNAVHSDLLVSEFYRIEMDNRLQCGFRCAIYSIPR